MKTFIYAFLVITTITRLHAEDPENDLQLLGGADEEKDYEILLERLGKTFFGFPRPVSSLPSINPSSDVHYGYEEDSQYPPQRWAQAWPTCGGIRQSPINIDLNSCKKDLALFPLKFKNFEARPLSTTVTNVGHSVQYSFNFKTPPTVTRGILNLKQYIFAQLHFHFGKTDDVGSEHTINSKPAALEMHLVFYKSNYGSVAHAAQFSDGLVVVAALFNPSDDVPDKLFTEYLSQVKVPAQTITVQNAKGTRLIDFIGSLNTKFVRYEGSLTTPGCSEAVTWYVSPSVKEISRGDLEAFRALMGDEGPMGGNFRPTQPLNGRKCYVI